MTYERPPSPLPDRVQVNQTLGVDAVLGPRFIGSDLAMTALTNEELAAIEKCHADREAWYVELESQRAERESGRHDLRPEAHNDRAALIAHITSLQGELQRTRDALEKAYPLCIGWAAHWKHDHGNFAPEHLETLDDCAKALGLDILPSKALTPPTGT